MPETEEYRTVLVFEVLLSSRPITRYYADKDLLDSNINMAEEIGLHVKGVLCDRKSQNCATLQKFINGIYTKRRPDRSVYKIVLMYDYVHILESHYKKLKRNPRHFYHSAVKTKERDHL